MSSSLLSPSSQVAHDVATRPEDGGLIVLNQLDAELRALRADSASNLGGHYARALMHAVTRLARIGVTA